VSRWLENNVPSWLVLTGLVVVITGSAIAVQMYVRHRFPELAEGEHNDVAKTTFSVIGPVYGFFIGFIVASLWGQLNAADLVARTEGAYAVQMARDLNMFDKADSERIRQSLLEYARSAVAEWPEAANGRTMPAAENALTQLYTTYENIEPRDDKQRIFLTSSLDSLKQMSLARTQRLLTARTNTGPPLSLWGVIF
jgi:hypothetical protein